MLGVRFSHFDPRADIEADAEEHRHPPFSERDLRVHRPPIQFRPRSGRSSMRIKATRLAIRHRTPNANKPRKTCARSTPSENRAARVVIHLLLEVSRIVPMPGPTTPLAAVLVFATPATAAAVWNSLRIALPRISNEMH